MHGGQSTGGHDPHISGHEARAFPGAAHQRARRMSVRLSASGSDGSADLSASGGLEGGLAKLVVKEDED